MKSMNRLRRALRRVFNFRIMIQALAVLLVGAVTVYVINSMWTEKAAELETGLKNYQATIVKNNAELLSSQLVKIVLQGKEMSRSRMFRIALEGLDAAREAEAEKAQEDFRNFVRVSGFLEGHLFDLQGRLFATTEVRFEGDVSDYQDPIERVIETRTPLFSPLRSSSGLLVSDLFLPVFPAKALSNSVDPVKVLVLTVPLTKMLRSFLAMEESLNYDSRIHLIQQTGESFEETVFRYPDNLQLQSVAASLRGVSDVLFGVRSDLYGEKAVYSTATMIPAIRWWVMMETDAGVIEARLREYESISGFLAGLGLLALTLAVITINLVVAARSLSRRNEQLENELAPSRKERNVLRRLCNALPFPVSLKERESGEYRYVNRAFSEFTGFDQEAAVGITDNQVFTYADADDLNQGEQIVAMSGSTYVHEMDITKGMDRTLVQVMSIPCSVRESGDSILTIFRDITDEKHTVEQAIETRQQIINALVRAVESVPFLDGQTSLMRMLSVEIAETMLLSDADCATVEAASILSQVGKTFIPKDILQKEGELTDEEFLETKKYVEHTCRILEGIKFDLPITQTIRQIQETLDGSGYPKGLKGREVSRLARILGVVNTFSALVKNRAYRKAKSAQEAVDILQSQADKKFDATVIESLEAVIRTPRGREILRGNGVEI